MSYNDDFADGRDAGLREALAGIDGVMKSVTTPQVEIGVMIARNVILGLLGLEDDGEGFD